MKNFIFLLLISIGLSNNSFFEIKNQTEDRITINSYMINQGCKSYLEGLLVPYYDLCLMTLCDGAIISNSSFSWWGAWLQNNSRDIISPDKDKWAGKLNTANYSDIIPDGWKVL